MATKATVTEAAVSIAPLKFEVAEFCLIGTAPLVINKFSEKARNLMLDPTSAVGQSTSLSSLDYRQDVASWASDGQVGMNEDDIAVARSYRYPAPPPIVLRP